MDRRRRRPPHAADARDAARQPEDYGTKQPRCRRAEWDPSVGRLLVSAFHSGTVIGQVGRRYAAPSPQTY